MKNILEASFRGTTKFKRGLPTNINMRTIPLTELSSLAEDIHIKAYEASRNTDVDV